jgi:hypothetical protein
MVFRNRKQVVQTNRILVLLRLRTGVPLPYVFFRPFHISLFKSHARTRATHPPRYSTIWQPEKEVNPLHCYNDHNTHCCNTNDHAALTSTLYTNGPSTPDVVFTSSRCSKKLERTLDLAPELTDDYERMIPSPWREGCIVSSPWREGYIVSAAYRKENARFLALNHR